jgi:hypothetical protein
MFQIAKNTGGGGGGTLEAKCRSRGKEEEIRGALNCNKEIQQSETI